MALTNSQQLGNTCKGSGELVSGWLQGVKLAYCPGGTQPVEKAAFQWKLEERHMKVARHDLHVHTLQQRLISAKGSDAKKQPMLYRSPYQ
jgi:hypothetical protein